MPFQIVRNDITKMHVDAIVNTASPVPGYGAGIDKAVYKAAGEKELLARRQEIGAIEPGNSVITSGFDLPARYIIHTVGMPWQGGECGEEAVIRKCYKSVFEVALENDIESLAIPLIASGSYGFPKGIALRIALSEIEAFLATRDMDIYLVVFDEKAFALSSELYGDIDEYISDNYVEEKVEEEYHSMGGECFEAYLEDASAEDAHVEDAHVEDAPMMAQSMAPERSFGRVLSGMYSNMRPVKSRKKGATESEARSLDDVVNNLDKTFMELVFSFADARGLSDVEVQKRANLDRKAFSKLKCGTTKNPSKATALALAIALRLNLDDTKDLLSRAGLALSPCSKQDLIVRYFIEREVYDIYEINVALFEHGEQLLGSQNA